MTAAPQSCVSSGAGVWGGPLLREGTSSWPIVHLFTGLGSSDTMRATYILLHQALTHPPIDPSF